MSWFEIIKGNYEQHDFDNEVILYPINDAHTSSVIVLNEIGAHIYRMIDRACSQEQIVSFLTERYSASTEQILQDIAKCTETLRQHHAIK